MTNQAERRAHEACSADGRAVLAVDAAPLAGHVVLLDSQGRPRGTTPKVSVHGIDTPLHLALSCYVFRPDGDVLLTRRASAKRTWPGVWTNSCCGHPRPGEAMEDAVRRHLRDELGMSASCLTVVLPDFTYRASMSNGLTEHEVCPVHVALSPDTPQLDPDEADDYEWVSWSALCERARDEPESLSPWSVTQIERMASLGVHPAEHLRRAGRARSGAGSANRLDPFELMGERTSEVLGAFIEETTRDLAALAPNAHELCAPIRALVEAGGKRLRPCLVHCGYDAAGGGDSDSADLAHAAAAVEMLHTFALLHDDVMDRSALRRGQPTAHERFDELHRTTRQGGDARWFGLSAAIVAGDLAFVWADQLLDRIAAPAEIQLEVRRLFDVLRHEVIVGQYLDIRLAGPVATDHEAALVALLKSGRYTVTRPLGIGAALAGASSATQEILRRFGDAAGVAFQLRDDVIGVFGDVAVTGKGASDDIRSGKASLLLVRALELASPCERDELAAALGNEELDDDRVERCREIVRRSGALASIERLIEAKLGEALDAAHDLPLGARERLAGVADLLVHRES